MSVVKNYIYFGFTFLMIFLTMGCASLGTYNPATGRSEFIFISTATEVKMGQDAHKQLQKQFKISKDVKWTDRIGRIGRRIAQVSDRQDYQYHFYVVEKDELNAFTTPGGNIYVFTGLMDKLPSDDALASVVAHEVGHCAARHVVKKYQAAMGYNLVGSIVFSQVEAERQATQLVRGSNTLMRLIFSAYGRQDEFEADLLGVKYLKQAGFNKNGSIEALELLLKESKGPRVPVMLRSHPHLEDRIIALRQEIDRLQLEEELRKYRNSEQ